MSNKLITLLASQGGYPLGLAQEIGIEGAIAVSQFISLGGGGYVHGERLAERLKGLAVKKPHQVIEDLRVLGVLSLHNGGSMLKLNTEFFEDLDDLQAEIKSSIWQDKEFLALLAKWKLILTAKAVRKTEKDFTAMFEGKDPDSVKQALQYSIDNRLTTLYYRENNRGNAKADSFNRGGRVNRGTGGGTSTESEGSSQTPRAVHKGLESLE
jgi:hypothetical protein